MPGPCSLSKLRSWGWNMVGFREEGMVSQHLSPFQTCIPHSSLHGNANSPMQTDQPGPNPIWVHPYDGGPGQEEFGKPSRSPPLQVMRSLTQLPCFKDLPSPGQTPPGDLHAGLQICSWGEGWVGSPRKTEALRHYSQWQPWKPRSTRALHPQNQTWAWRSAAALWTLTTTVTSVLLGNESSQGLKGCEGPQPTRDNWEERAEAKTVHIRTSFQRWSQQLSMTHAKQRKENEKNLTLPRKRTSTSTKIKEKWLNLAPGYHYPQSECLSLKHPGTINAGEAGKPPKLLEKMKIAYSHKQNTTEHLLRHWKPSHLMIKQFYAWAYRWRKSSFEKTQVPQVHLRMHSFKEPMYEHGNGKMKVQAKSDPEKYWNMTRP